MLSWLLLILGTVAVVELFFALPLARVSQTLFTAVRKATRTIGARHVSDHWKEKVLPAYAQQLLMSSLRLFALVLAAISPMLGLGLIGPWLGIDFFALLASGTGIAASTALAIFYALIRQRFTAHE